MRRYIDSFSGIPTNHLRNVIQVPGHQRMGWAKLRTQQVFSIYGFYKQKVEVRLKHAYKDSQTYNGSIGNGT